VLTVADTGEGIPLPEQPHIFERFYRVDKARSRNGTDAGSGAGLGLSIARWIAEAHGGRLELVSSDEKGSVFAATLPADRGT
jgi:signal transduction histidine kinase